jgi:hypothetical protein
MHTNGPEPRKSMEGIPDGTRIAFREWGSNLWRYGHYDSVAVFVGDDGYVPTRGCGDWRYRTNA